MGLVGACDLVAAGPSSTFALTEARRFAQGVEGSMLSRATVATRPPARAIEMADEKLQYAAGNFYVHDGHAISRIDGNTGVVSRFADVDVFIGQDLAKLTTGFWKGMPLDHDDKFTVYTINRLPQYVLTEWVKHQLTEGT